MEFVLKMLATTCRCSFDVTISRLVVWIADNQFVHTVGLDAANVSVVGPSFRKPLSDSPLGS